MAQKANAKLASKRAQVVTKKSLLGKGAVKKVSSKKAAPPSSSRKAVGKRAVDARSSRGKRRSLDGDLLGVSPPLGYTIGTLAVDGDVAGLIIGGTFYPLTYQMGHPVSVLYPINPEPGSDEDYLHELELAMLVLAANLIGLIPFGTTYTPPHPSS